MKRTSRIGITFGLLLTIAAGCGRAGGADEVTARPEQETMAAAAVAVHRVPIDDAPVKGDSGALVTLVAFSDYECSFCTKGHAVVEQLQKVYGSKLRVVARHNPLPFHAHAEPAALAAVAAAEQGKFWEMDERLFADTGVLDEERLSRIAREVGLDVERFNAARKGAGARATIERDRTLAASLGVRGTPAYFINGRRIEGARPIDDFKKVIDEEIRKAEGILAKGVRAADLYDTLMRGALAPKPAAEKSPSKAAFCETAGDPGDGPCERDPAKVAAVSEEIEDVSVGTTQVRGPASAPITVVLFSDFECSFCGKVESTLHALEEQYPGKVRIAFRNYPLPSHDHARLAAKASLAANEQGRFWEYHDALFAHQDKLDRPSLEGYAQDLGLDMKRFRAALDDAALEAVIDADDEEASHLHLRGTPSAFVNGRPVFGAQPLEVFRAAAEKALAAGAR